MSSQEEQHHRENNSGPERSGSGSGRGSPLSVSELPQSGGHTGNDVNFSDRSTLQAAPEGNPEGMSGRIQSPEAERARGHPRSAISRIGYMSDANEASTVVPDETEAAAPKESPADHVWRPPALTAASSPAVTPRDIKGSRALSRQRVQHMHLAVPTPVGHIRPRAKPVESPRGMAASPQSARSRPAALTRMTTLQDSNRSPLSGTATPSVLRRAESAGSHISGQPEEADRDIILVSGNNPTAQAVRESASHERKSPITQHPPSPAQGDTEGLPCGLETSAGPRSEGMRLREDTTESGTTAIDEVKGAEGAAPRRPAHPARVAAMQKTVSEVFAAESERRAAALTSRISSRAISRTEGSTELKRFAHRADVAHAAAEQLRRMEAGTAVDGIQGSKSEPLEQSGGKEGSYRDAEQKVCGGSQPHSDGGMEQVKRFGNLPAATPPTAPPKDGSPVGRKDEHEATESAHLQRSRMPHSIHAAQHELAVAAEVDEQRRLAAVISRARSRIVSRAEGSADRSSFSERADVAKAAAEQLRKMEQASSKQVPDSSLPPYRRVKAMEEAAKKIQAVWRGNRLRVWVAAARAVALFSRPAIPQKKERALRLSQRRGLCEARLPQDLRAAGC